MTALSTTFLLPPPTHRPPSGPHRTQILTRKLTTTSASLSDPFVLSIAEKLEDSLPTSPSLLDPLRLSSSNSLLSRPWPNPSLEPFRFTDTSFLRRPLISPSPAPSAALDLAVIPNSLVIVDGHLVPELSSFPEGIYAGGVSGLPEGFVKERVREMIGGEMDGGDLFYDLNGVGAPDVAVVYVPEGVRVVDEPVWVRFGSLEAEEVSSEKLPVSNPRVLVVVEKGAEVAIVEEHFGVGGGEGRSYWENSVFEVVIGEGGKVSHSYLQRQSRNSAHIKWTIVRQESSSVYELVEVSAGARLSRHNLHVQQLGPDTVTDHSAFHICQSNQIQDLHSKLVLDYPRGYSRQIHKSIVAHSSGHAVFDGNIKVNRYAQQTDAGQLTRTLLLAPRATANVKPNLQIIADDVKCSHGAAISDLEDDQLFYFRARGVDLQTARDALIFSFGAEVVAKLPFEPLRKETANHIRNLLASKSSSV